MKIEPEEALEKARCHANRSQFSSDFPHDWRSEYSGYIAGFTEGQSSPKIKRLEWVDVWDDYADAITPFGHYTVRSVKSDGERVFELIDTRKESSFYYKLTEAKAAAQSDFVRRVMECIDVEQKNEE